MARTLRSVVFHKGAMWRPRDDIPDEVASEFGDHVWTENEDEVDRRNGFRGVGDTPRSEGSLFDTEQLMRFNRPSTEDREGADRVQEGVETPTEVPVTVEPPKDDAESAPRETDEVPAAAEEQSPAAPAEEPKAPPRSGKGSSLEAWQAYARKLGIEPGPDDDRDDVMAAVDAHRLAQREEQK